MEKKARNRVVLVCRLRSHQSFYAGQVLCGLLIYGSCVKQTRKQSKTKKNKKKKSNTIQKKTYSQMNKQRTDDRGRGGEEWVV